ncbi:ATP-binding protein [Pseudogemmatithrix spongiicola]|uniref:histidine kinase n=1 Tax=Pseudogemmatithrix spongiicola TaxID=3062599 RepID=A0AA49JU38_9BACT|nr:ATP-binding protein [Gemmatimonadaceae bacterium 'strain 138']WKW14583.1 ATP-binding protein [Gemmatimonadaceae bacterium 'strain 318']
MTPTPRRALSLRSLLLVAATLSLAYVAVLAVQVIGVLVPAAVDVRGRARDVLADHDRIHDNLARLQGARRDLSRLAPPFVPGAPRPDPAEVRDTVLALLDRGAVIRAAVERSDVPIEMRLLLADAAELESAIAVQLLDAERAIAIGETQRAIESLRRSGVISDSATRVLSLAQREAVAGVLAQQERLLTQVERLQRWTIAWGAVGLLLFGIGAWLTRRRLYLPVREMEQAVQRVAGGDLDTEVAVRYSDELGRLARHLNAMTVVLRERAAEESRRRESLTERFGRILDESANEIFVFDARSRRLLQANRGAREGLGYDASSIRDLALDALLTGIPPERLDALVAELRSHSTPRVHLSAWLRRRDGTLRATELTLQSATDADAEVIILVAEDARLRQQVRALDARLRSFLQTEASQVANGDVVRAFKPLVRMTAEALEADFCGVWRGTGERAATIAAFDAGSGSLPHPIALDEVLADPAAYSTTLRANPREAAVLVIVRRESGYTAEELTFIAAVADVATRAFEAEERRRLERALERAQRIDSLGQLAGGVAHDFNNLLTAILGNLEATRADLEKGSPMDVALAEAEHAALRAADLTRQLLTFARRQMLETRAVHVAPRIAESEAMLRRLVGAERTLVLEVQPDLGTVRLGAGQLEQLLVNLVVNARDATAPGGTVTLRARRLEAGDPSAGEPTPTEPSVELVVQDSGVGMDRETLERVFEPFFTTKSVGQGTGLGLAVCHGIVENAGGTIRVVSAPGEGTTFTIRLPAGSERSSPSRGSGAVTGLGSVVLVAEDEPSIRALVSRMLAARGFRVLAGEDGVAALSAMDASDDPPVLLVTDVVMPRLGGVELAREMRRRVPGIPVLFMSGYTSSAVLPDGDLRDAAFIAKPFSTDDLMRRVAELLETPTPPGRGPR